MGKAEMFKLISFSSMSDCLLLCNRDTFDTRNSVMLSIAELRVPFSINAEEGAYSIPSLLLHTQSSIFNATTFGFRPWAICTKRARAQSDTNALGALTKAHGNELTTKSSKKKCEIIYYLYQQRKKKRRDTLHTVEHNLINMEAEQCNVQMDAKGFE